MPFDSLKLLCSNMWKCRALHRKTSIHTSPLKLLFHMTYRGKTARGGKIKAEGRGKREVKFEREMSHNSTRKAIMSRLQLIFYLCANWKWPGGMKNDSTSCFTILSLLLSYTAFNMQFSNWNEISENSEHKIGLVQLMGYSLQTYGSGRTHCKYLVCWKTGGILNIAIQHITSDIMHNYTIIQSKDRNISFFSQKPLTKVQRATSAASGTSSVVSSTTQTRSVTTSWLIRPLASCLGNKHDGNEWMRKYLE